MLAGLGRVSRHDAVVAAAVGVVQISVTTLAAHHQRHLDLRPLNLGGYLLLGLGPALLIWCNRFPAAVLLGAFGCTLAYSLLDYPRGPIYLALIVAFVHAVINGRRVVAYLLLPVGYLTLTLLAATVTGHARPGLPYLVGIAAWLLVLLAGSELIRIRRAFGRERQRRRREAELTREEEVRRRATEERLQIARELHDVMAHSISLINVQAGVALELMDARPEQARQALTAIKAASKEALLEVQSMLSALRSPPAVERRPARSLTALDELVDGVRQAGLPVRSEVIGEPLPLSPDVDRAAARIVQEALTNVARHATGEQTRVKVEYRPGPPGARLLIVVENDGPANRPKQHQPNSGGRGIAGMRERAQVFGGSLQAGPRPDGGFRVRAELPIYPPEPKTT